MLAFRAAATTVGILFALDIKNGRVFVSYHYMFCFGEDKKTHRKKISTITGGECVFFFLQKCPHIKNRVCFWKSQLVFFSLIFIALAEAIADKYNPIQRHAADRC